MSVVDAVSQRVMGLFAVYFGDALQHELEPMVYDMLGSPELWSKIPDYDALQEFLTGMGLFAEDPRQGLAHLLNAGELDPYFFYTWKWANQAQRNLVAGAHGPVQGRPAERRRGSRAS